MKKLFIMFVTLLVSQIFTAGNGFCEVDQFEWISRISQTQRGLQPVYDPRGKIDPFQPIISDDQPKPVLKIHQIECVSNPTLEKLHLSQIELSGIVITEHKSVALVQEKSNGKGHIVHEDMCIDKGKVAEILKDRIIVQKEMRDLHGVVRISKSQMKLKKKIN